MCRMIEAMELHLFDLLLKAVHLHKKKTKNQEIKVAGRLSAEIPRNQK